MVEEYFPLGPLTVAITSNAALLAKIPELKYSTLPFLYDQNKNLYPLLY